MTTATRPLALSVAASGRTDIGQVRDGNEDAFAIGDLDRGELWTGDGALATDGVRGPLLVVCDGMGGSEGGEVASELAAGTVWREMYAAQTTGDAEVFARLLRRAVRAANRRVYQQARREISLRGMGTTVSAAGFVGDRLVIATIGDSRAYVLRGAVLTQVSRDQSLVSALLSAGQLTMDDARVAQAQSAILQAVGVTEDVEPSLSMVDLRRGDRVLLCTDGLYNQLGESALAAILMSARPPELLARTLVDAARAAGGADNITAVVAVIDGEAVRPPASDDDLPHFVEFDPREEGDRALTSTSFVARRLAARVGIGEDPGPPVVPATGQHRALRIRAESEPPVGDVPGPARQRLGPPRRMGIVVWLGLAAVAATLAWWLGGR
jgi:serine/threonine protein phosphatase PrpC